MENNKAWVWGFVTEWSGVGGLTRGDAEAVGAHDTPRGKALQ